MADNIAWAAGLFEGEGYCGIRGTQRQPAVTVQMTDEDVVRRFCASVGRGSVRRYHYPPRKVTWQWSVQGASDVLHVLGLLWGHLGERRQERAYEVIERAARINEDRGYCKRGHDLSDPAHLYVHKKTGKRHCGTCRRDYQRNRP